MAENWTCHICETTCDGDACPVCGTLRTRPSVFDPPRVIPPDPIAGNDGDERWKEAIRREEWKSRMRRKASLNYSLFLVIGMLTVYFDLNYIYDFGIGLVSVFSWESILDWTRLLLFIIVTASFMRTVNGGKNAVKGTLCLFILAIFVGCVNLIILFSGPWNLLLPFLACLLMVPAAILECGLLYRFSKRMQTL